MRDTIHFRDPIHGTIHLSNEELRVVEHPVYQRLRGIKQLGFSDHAFPGATHTRFAHGLGAMQMAGAMFDGALPAEATALTAAERRRLRQALRLAVLLHDVGHAPLSHATEVCMPPRERLGLSCFSKQDNACQASHEDYTLLLVLRSDLTDVLRRLFGPIGVDPEDVAQLISGRFPQRVPTFQVGGIDYGPLLSQIVSGELDADRMDYLQRDSFYAGVNYGKFDDQWLLNNLAHHVAEDGRAYLALSHRAIFAFEDFLLSRYHMFVSVYYHHTAIGFDSMLTRFIAEQPQALALPETAETYLHFDDVAFWSVLRASSNEWARRIVTRDLYRRILELNADEDIYDVAALRQALDVVGIDHFVSNDAGVLSRYYGADQQPTPIYVLNRALGRATNVSRYSKLFERYAQPARLIRVYCRPDQREQARQCLREAVPRRDWEQLRLGL